MRINYLKLYLCLTFTGITVYLFIQAYHYSIIIYQDENAVISSSLKQTPHEKNRKRILNSTEINDEICTFWRVEHYIEPNEGSKAFMYAACELAARLNSQSAKDSFN